MATCVQPWVDEMMCCGDRSYGPGTTKSQSQQALVTKAVETSAVFMHIAKDKVGQVVDQFRGPASVAAGTTVIRQGDSVDRGEPCLFLLESGSVEIWVVKAGEGGKPAYVATMAEEGVVFGHLSSLYDVPRTATVVAASDCLIWHLDRDSFQLAIDCDQRASIVAQHAKTVSKAHIHPQTVSPSFAIFNLGLVLEGEMDINLTKYWNLVKNINGLSCTLSCFSVWNAEKKKNKVAKIIPAVRASNEEPVRIFFFDDNIEWAGKANSSGIVNLRNVENAEFVEFGEGTNGFSRAEFAENTVVHWSTEYRNVLVQANILDAMEDEEYFNKILAKYSNPGEKLVIFMDINSTIISVDSVSSKDMGQLVLGTMFEFITLTPHEPFEYQWEDTKRPPVKVTKPIHCKKLVKDFCKDDKEYYDQFYTYENCAKIITSLADKATLKCAQQDTEFTLQTFKAQYDRYCVSLVGGTNSEGIVMSWLRCFGEQTKHGHSIILNTFGMDSRKVIVKTVPDERQVLQMCINFDLWGNKDKQTFNKMYGSSR